MSLRSTLSAALIIAAGGAGAVPAIVEPCVECHGQDGSGVGYDYVPILAGTPAPHLEEAIFAYIDGARRCVHVPLMCEAVADLSDADVRAIAEHYGSLPRVSSGEAFDPKLAAIGQDFHAQHCAKCHVLPDDPDAADALGIPLHGQRSEYLWDALGAYITGDRESLLPQMADKLALMDPEIIEALVSYYASWTPGESD